MARTKTIIGTRIEEQDVPKADVPKKENVVYEIQRTKGDIHIVIKSGKLSKRREWIRFKLEGVWRMYFPNNFIKQTTIDRKGKTSVRYLCRFNLYYSEALKAGQDLPEYDQALENQLINEWHSQYKKAIGAIAGLLSALARDRSIQLLVLLAAVFGIPIGMTLWPNLIYTPNTIVHWITRR